MRNRQLEQQNQVQNAATAALAAASKTPFWTAFKITLGIGLAQLAMFLMAIGGLGAAATVAYLLLK